MDKIKKIKPIEQYSYLLAILSLMITAGLLFFKIDLHSDILFLDDLFTDLLKQNGSWADWKFSPAPSYVPDMLLYFIAYHILPTAALRIYFVTICQIAMIGFLSLWLANKIKPGLSISAKNLIILLLSYVCLVAFYTTASIGIFFNSNNIQVSVLIFSLLLIGLFLDYFEKQRKITAFYIIIFAGLAKASSMVFTLCFTIPAFIALLTVLIFFKTQANTKQHQAKIVKAILVLIASQMVGFVIEHFLTINYALSERLHFTRDAINRSLKTFDDSLRYVLNPDNLYTAIFAFLCFFSFIVLSILLVRFLVSVFLKTNAHQFTNLIENNVNPNDWKLYSVIVFTCFSIPITWFGSILSGAYIDLFCFRYFMLAATLILLISIIKAYSFFESKSLKYRFAISILTFAIIALTVNSVIFALDKFKDKPLKYIAEYGAIEKNELKVANCLIAIEKSGVKLNSGIADFWYARGVRQYLPDRNYIAPMLNDTSPFFWISTIGPIVRPEKYNINYNFVILRKSYEVGQFDFTPLTIGKYLPSQFTRHDCKAVNAEIWVYSGDELDNKMKQVFTKYAVSNGLSDKMDFTANMLNSTTGKIIGTERVAEGNKDSEGYLTFGPYIKLKNGEYKFTLTYNSESENNESLGYIEVGNFSSSKNVFFKSPLKNAKNGVVTNKIMIDEEIKDIEVRTWFNGKPGKLTIKSFKVEKI